MEIRNSQKTKFAEEEQAQYETDNHKMGILITGGNLTTRQELMELLNQESEVGVCVEAENANQMVETMSKQHVDLVITDISSKDRGDFKLVDEIKLRYPNLPVLILSIHDEATYVKHALQAETKESPAHQRATEQIVKAIHYVHSLLRNRIYGFTVFVKIERST